MTEHNPTVPILLVDRNVEASYLFRAILEHVGVRSVVAVNGSDALRLAEYYAPKVIFTSIMLDGIDGFELCAQLRSRPETKGSYIVALTGFSDYDIAQQTRNAGFDKYILKPATFLTLMSTLAPFIPEASRELL